MRHLHAFLYLLNVYFVNMRSTVSAKLPLNSIHLKLNHKTTKAVYLSNIILKYKTCPQAETRVRKAHLNLAIICQFQFTLPTAFKRVATDNFLVAFNASSLWQKCLIILTWIAVRDALITTSTYSRSIEFASTSCFFGVGGVFL